MGSYHKRYTSTEPKAQRNTALAATAVTRVTSDMIDMLVLVMELSVWCSHWCAAAALGRKTFEVQGEMPNDRVKLHDKLLTKCTCWLTLTLSDTSLSKTVQPTGYETGDEVPESRSCVAKLDHGLMGNVLK